MTDPFEDGGWDTLAAELGVETIPAPKPEEPPPLPPEAFEQEQEPAPSDITAALFQLDPLPDADEPGSDTEIIELGGTDEQKKRRRRRRRGKKKDGEPGTEAEAEDAPETEDHITQPSEMLREIIANWDVPSWDDIVGGLYRPNR